MDDKRWAQLLGFIFIHTNRITAAAMLIVAEMVRRARILSPDGRCSCATYNGRRCSGPNCASFSRRVMCGEACGDECCNRMFSNEWGIVELQMGGKDNTGKVVVAGVDIPADTYICQLTGLLRVGTAPPHRRFIHRVEIESDQPLVLDCTMMGNMSRYLMDNEDNPNCVVESWIVDSNVVLVLRSIRPIRRNDILSINYPQMRLGYKESTTCNRNSQVYPPMHRNRPTFAEMAPPQSQQENQEPATGNSMELEELRRSPAYNALRRISDPIPYEPPQATETLDNTGHNAAAEGQLQEPPPQEPPAPTPPPQEQPPQGSPPTAPSSSSSQQ